MFFHICSVFIQLILTLEGHHLVQMDVCVCMYVCTCTSRARVVQPAQSRSSASTRSQALTLILILTTIFDWKWSSTLRSRFSVDSLWYWVDLLAVESIQSDRTRVRETIPTQRFNFSLIYSWLNFWRYIPTQIVSRSFCPECLLQHYGFKIGLHTCHI